MQSGKAVHKQQAAGRADEKLTTQSGKAGRKQQVAGQTAELFRGVCEGRTGKRLGARAAIPR